MRVYHSLSEASVSGQITELALGFFDGLHLGHREVIVGSKSSVELDCTAIISFQQHPQSVLFKDNPIKLITGLPHKLRILKTWKVQHLILLPFDLITAQKSAEDFLTDLAHAFPNLKELRVGQNFRFGHQRRGDTALLKQWAADRSVRILAVTSLHHGDEPISSSRIRTLLTEKNLVLASKLLGRNYSTFGTVCIGNQLGRQLGFPTINLTTEDGFLLPYGVYSGKALLENGDTYRTVINIGVSPTVTDANKPRIEAHLLDFQRDLYGQELELEFSDYLRDEKKFHSREDLVKQIQTDIKALAV